MSEHEITYECDLCGNIFKALRSNRMATARCPQCGSMKVTSKKIDMLTATHKVRMEAKSIILEPRSAENIICKYVCIECTKKFELELRPSDSPYCPFCKKVNVKALTPAASIINDRGRTITNKHQIKLIKFIKRGWENLNEFESAGEALVQTAKRIGVPEGLAERLEKAVKASVSALDKHHGRLLKRYKRGDW